jgi:GT2 family glycosyltransferase
MNISFVILTWNSEVHVKRCLEAITHNIPGRLFPYEIFIVDNGSIDGSIEIVEEFTEKYPDIVKLIRLERNGGTTYPRNLALKQVSGKYIAVMDSDVELAPGVIEELIDVLEQDNRNGIVVPRLTYADGTLQKSTDNFPTFFTKFQRYIFLKFIEKRENAKERDEPYPVEYAISAFWLLTHKVLREVGLLDEKIFYAPEDVDYCLRIWEQGYRIIYVPHVSLIHDAQEMTRNFRINRATIEHIKGLLYFFKKHKYCVRRPVFDGQ